MSPRAFQTLIADMTPFEPCDHSQLLVSVRSASEAAAALAGGADIIDVKEPAHGPLGSASPSVIQAVSDALQSHGTKSVPLSAALGELRELKSIPKLPRDCAWAKCGLSGLAGTDWRQAWLSVQREFHQRSPLTELIPVVYADWQACAAPSPDAVFRIAMDAGAPGILFDTFEKRGQTLVDALPIPVLADWIDQIRQANCFVALAGSLRLSQIAELAPLRPDILAVRSAACLGGRQGHVDSGRVAAIKSAIEHSCSTSSLAVSGSRLSTSKNSP